MKASEKDKLIAWLFWKSVSDLKQEKFLGLLNKVKWFLSYSLNIWKEQKEAVHSPTPCSSLVLTLVMTISKGDDPVHLITIHLKKTWRHKSQNFTEKTSRFALDDHPLHWKVIWRGREGGPSKNLPSPVEQQLLLSFPSAKKQSVPQWVELCRSTMLEGQIKPKVAHWVKWREIWYTQNNYSNIRFWVKVRQVSSGPWNSAFVKN